MYSHSCVKWGAAPSKNRSRERNEKKAISYGVPLVLLSQKQPKYSSIDKWINKIWYIHTMEYYLAIKKNAILPFATTWMNLENIMLSD